MATNNPHFNRSRLSLALLTVGALLLPTPELMAAKPPKVAKATITSADIALIQTAVNTQLDEAIPDLLVDSFVAAEIIDEEGGSFTDKLEETNGLAFESIGLDNFLAANTAIESLHDQQFIGKGFGGNICAGVENAEIVFVSSMPYIRIGCSTPGDSVTITFSGAAGSTILYSMIVRGRGLTQANLIRTTLENTDTATVCNTGICAYVELSVGSGDIDVLTIKNPGDVVHLSFHAREGNVMTRPRVLIGATLEEPMNSDLDLFLKNPPAAANQQRLDFVAEHVLKPFAEVEDFRDEATGFDFSKGFTEQFGEINTPFGGNFPIPPQP